MPGAVRRTAARGNDAASDLNMVEAPDTLECMYLRTASLHRCLREYLRDRENRTPQTPGFVVFLPYSSDLSRNTRERR